MGHHEDQIVITQFISIQVYRMRTIAIDHEQKKNNTADAAVPCTWKPHLRCDGQSPATRSGSEVYRYASDHTEKTFCFAYLKVMTLQAFFLAVIILPFGYNLATFAYILRLTMLQLCCNKKQQIWNYTIARF